MTVSPVVLRPSRLKGLLLLAVSLVFVAGGVLMIRQGNATVGWIVALTFGAGIAAAIVLLMPGSSFLRLEPDTFTMRTLYRDHIIPWTAVTDFRVGRLPVPGSRPAVFFGFTDDRAPGARAVARTMASTEGCCPTPTARRRTRSQRS